MFFAAVTASACSLQNFDYLKDESASGGGGGKGGTTSSGGSDSSSGGTSATTGGGQARGGSSGSSSHDGGAGGGGAGGDGDAGGEGGAGREGGAGGVPDGGDAGASTGGAVNEGGQAGSANGGVGGNDGNGGTSGGAPPVGNLLLNPSFESDLQNWTVDPAEAITNRYVFVQFPTSGGTTKDGAKELATWHETSEYSIFIYQTVRNLVPGTYALSGWFSSTQSRGAYLFARNCSATEQQEVIPTTAFTWFEISIPAVEVTGTTCEVGIFIHNVAQDWFNADAFSFEKVP